MQRGWQEDSSNTSRTRDQRGWRTDSCGGALLIKSHGTARTGPGCAGVTESPNNLFINTQKNNRCFLHITQTHNGSFSTMEKATKELDCDDEDDNAVVFQLSDSR